MGTLLNRDAILAVEDLVYEEVAVPEWGGTVRVRGMTGDERDAFEVGLALAREASSAQLTDAHIRARLVALTVVDESGARLFSEADIPLLGRKSAAPLDRLYEAAQRLSRLRAADIEELRGNSDAGRSGDSTSGSPASSGE